MKRADWFFLISLLLVVAGLMGMFAHAEGIERQNCVVRGGHVLEVNGGRGGWICVPVSR